MVDFVANTDKLQAATGQVEATGSRFSGWSKSVAASIGAAFVTTGIVAFGKSAVTAATESEVATARLGQVFESMGDSTGQAAAAAEAYAASLSKQIGVEDEVIMQGQALLATFSEVSNETARQEGIFNRATAAAADLAAAGFGTMESNAVQLGKALQDPVKGINSLARAGVTFTDAQKAQIAALVESGQHLEAQKIILAAVESQVKGTAAATATEGQKMAVAWGEVSESIGGMLLPVLNQLAPLLASMAGFVQQHTTFVVAFGAALLGAAVALKVLTVAQIALNVAMSANVIGLIIIGIAALVAAIVLLATHWDTVVAAFKAGWEAIKNAAQVVFDWVVANWPLLLPLLLGPIGIAAAGIIKYWDQIMAAARTAVAAIKAVWETIKGFFSGVVAAVGAALDRFASWFQKPVDAAQKAISAIKSAWEAIKSFFSGVVANVGASLDKFASWFEKPVDAAQEMLQGIKAAVGKIADFIQSQVGAVSAAIRAIVNAIKTPINAVLGAWNAIGFTVPTITIPPVVVLGKTLFGGYSFGGWTIGTPDVPLLAKGGVISSPTLAIVGEGQGREIVAPESLLRQVMAENVPEIHVYIGDQELKGMVRTEVITQNTRVARTLMSGLVT